MAFEIWQTIPSVPAGRRKSSSHPVKLSGHDGIIARRLARGDSDVGEEIILDAAAVTSLLPHGVLEDPVFVWSSRDDRGQPQVSEILRVVVKCGRDSCDVLLHLRQLSEDSGHFTASSRESAEAMLLQGGIGRGPHTWRWAPPRMAIGGAIVGGR